MAVPLEWDLRRIASWEAYDRMVASGEYGALLNEGGELALSADSENAVTFFRTALGEAFEREGEKT